MNKTALITGASGGLGMEFAKLYAREGYDLVIVARSADKLEKLRDDICEQYGRSVWVLAQDLAQPNAAQRIYDYTAEQGITVTALVNNAGFGDCGNFWEVDMQRQTDLLQVNIMALVQLTRCFLPGMVSEAAARCSICRPWRRSAQGRRCAFTMRPRSSCAASARQ